METAPAHYHAVDAEVALVMDTTGPWSCALTDAFQQRVPEGATARRQLAALLDEWWRTELENCRAVVDVPGCLLPSRMVAALQAADPADLMSVLTTLAEPLDALPADNALGEVRAIDDVIVGSDTAPGHTVRWMVAHVLLPMMVVTSAFVLLLAWIG